MKNFFSGLIALTLLFVFLIYYMNILVSVPLAVIILLTLGMVAYDFYQSLQQADSNGKANRNNNNDG